MQIYTEYPKAWDAVIKDLKEAQKYIYFEHFILQDFSNDQIGEKILSVMKERSQAGVRVKVIVDAVGSYPLLVNNQMQEEMTEAGIEFYFFDIVPRWKAYFPFNLFHRNHRKIIVIDDRVAHIGGVIFEERAVDWHDINIRIEDKKYIAEMKGAFLRMWDEVKGEKEFSSEYDKDNGLILKNDPDRNSLYEAILSRIKKAKEKIVIVSPYISPNSEIFDALRDAKKRGVKVNFTVPEKGDALISNWVNLSYLPELYENDFCIHSYCECMNHGKLVVIDDWATVGSMNFDRLSFFHNRELNLVFDKKMDEIEQLLRDIKECCKNVDDDFFKKQSVSDRIRGVIGRAFRAIA